MTSRLPATHLTVLRILYRRLSGTDLTWAISGSTGFALQGVPAEPRDIDLQSDEAGAYRIEELFSEHVLRPVRFSQAERIRSHFGALSIEGLEVEIMGDIQKRREDGSWEGPPDLRRYRRVVEVEGMSLPVLSLEYEERAYRLMGRPERAELLRRWLAENGSSPP